MKEAERLRAQLKKKETQQVRSIEELSIIKATGLAWFRNHREPIAAAVEHDLLADADAGYKRLIAATDRASARSLYDRQLKDLRKLLMEVRGYVVDKGPIHATTPDTPPQFDLLVADSAMRAALTRRWIECAACIEAGAPLAATVMMGGLLEALMLARVNRESDKKSIFSATTAPKNKTDGKSLPLQEWTLRHYIDVAHELGWITGQRRMLAR